MPWMEGRPSGRDPTRQGDVNMEPQPFLSRSRIRPRDAVIVTGDIRSTLTLTLGSIHAANVSAAHALLAGGHTIGKIALEGWPQR